MVPFKATFNEIWPLNPSPNMYFWIIKRYNNHIMGSKGKALFSQPRCELVSPTFV